LINIDGYGFPEIKDEENYEEEDLDE